MKRLASGHPAEWRRWDPRAPGPGRRARPGAADKARGVGFLVSPAGLGSPYGRGRSGRLAQRRGRGRAPPAPGAPRAPAHLAYLVFWKSRSRGANIAAVPWASGRGPGNANLAGGGRARGAGAAGRRGARAEAERGRQEPEMQSPGRWWRGGAGAPGQSPWSPRPQRPPSAGRTRQLSAWVGRVERRSGGDLLHLNPFFPWVPSARSFSSKKAAGPGHRLRARPRPGVAGPPRGLVASPTASATCLVPLRRAAPKDPPRMAAVSGETPLLPEAVTLRTPRQGTCTGRWVPGRR